jgi:hypothetical protein
VTEKAADYSQVVTAAELDAALRSGGFQSVWHYVGDDFALREEDPNVVADIRSRGWPQGGIFVVRAPSSVNAAADVQRARAYGFPPGSKLALDVEPSVFDQDRTGWARACDAWAPGIRAGGYLAVIYGVDRTVAACGNQMDYLWRAVPGECDPAGPGLDPAWKPGVRMIQCGSGVFSGVSMDISYSQFSLAAAAPPPAPSLPQEDNDMASVARIRVANSGNSWVQFWPWVDDQGRLMLCWYEEDNGTMAGPAQLATGLEPHADIRSTYDVESRQVHFSGRGKDGRPVDVWSVVDQGWNVQMLGSADTAPVQLVDVAALATALAPHLQSVDEAKLAADLEAALQASVVPAEAAAVQAAFAKALSA